MFWHGVICSQTLFFGRLTVGLFEVFCALHVDLATAHGDMKYISIISSYITSYPKDAAGGRVLNSFYGVGDQWPMQEAVSNMNQLGRNCYNDRMAQCISCTIPEMIGCCCASCNNKITKRAASPYPLPWAVFLSDLFTMKMLPASSLKSKITTHHLYIALSHTLRTNTTTRHMNTQNSFYFKKPNQFLQKTAPKRTFGVDIHVKCMLCTEYSNMPKY